MTNFNAPINLIDNNKHTYLDDMQHEADCLHDNGYHAEAKKIEDEIHNINITNMLNNK